MWRCIFILIVVLLMGTDVFSQKKYSIKSRKAISLYESAGESYRNRDNEKTLQLLEQAIKQNPKFIEAWLFKADVLHSLGKSDLEIEAYKRAIEIDAVYFPNVHFNLANSYLKVGKYEDAKMKYRDFLSFPKISRRNKKLAEKRLKNCDFAMEMMKTPVEFHPINLGEAVNSEFDEYWPSLTADEEILVFTRLSPVENLGKEIRVKRQEDFWVSFRNNTTWRPAQTLSTTINTSNNEGAQSITADGRYMYFTACDRKQGLGRCDIYYSIKEGEEWSKPINLGKPVNSTAWDAQPSISADGRILYFVSNRKTGKGKMDIYQSTLLEILTDGRQRWSQPINLPVNTRDNEMSPFIHASNEYLIFASDGLKGMGGFDLYKSTSDKGKMWTKPVNLGYPINTFGDELGLVINAKSDKAYFSSDRLEGKGKDIFIFDLPVEHQPPAVSWLKGKVFDEVSKKKLFASLQLIDLATKDTIAQINSDRINGNYLVCLPAGREYLFSAESEGYLFYSDHFSLLDEKEKSSPQELDIPLHKLNVGKEVVLRNVFFNLDSWEILPKSELELNRLVELLKTQSNLKIEIGGHTDNTGSEEHNLNLSKNRAKSVCDYLIMKGISKDRLTYKGYASYKPIDTNANEIGRSRNRRTEFKIVK